MKNNLSIALALTATLAAWSGSAQAQYQYQYQGNYAAAYQQQPPLYPYAAAPQPNAYVVQPQYAPRAYPYVGAGSAPRILRRTVRKSDPALVEQLRQRVERRQPVINKRIVVHERPRVIEHTRVVDDPPIVVRRERVIDEPPQQNPMRSRAEKASTGQRVIRAEAEVTILGPDRMSIRLFRKRGEAAPPPQASED